MKWLKDNWFLIVAIAGIIAGYSTLQYRVGEIEKRMSGNKLNIMEKSLEDEIQKIKDDFQDERVLVWKKLTELEMKK